MKKIILIFGALVLAAFAWWTLSPLFINETVDDTLPESATVAVAQSFPIQDTKSHPATGDVRVIDTEEETIIRYENYAGTNGPDIFVYLATDLQATEFINLGRSKGNVGNANYDVPDDVDISEYRYVMTWCKAFGVLFDYAEIN